MHPGALAAGPGDSDKPDQALRARFAKRLERSARAERGLPFLLVDKIVQLDQVDLIDAQPFQRSMQARARALISTIAGLGREEEATPMLAHPWSDPQLRFAVRGCGVDMGDT